MLLRALLIGLIALATPSFADIDLPFVRTAESRFGVLSIEATDLDGNRGHQLLVNGTPVPGVADFIVDIRKVMESPADPTQDWVLVNVSGGGNACPMDWLIVVLDANGARPSPRFGTCSEALTDLRIESRALIMDIPSFDPAIDYVRFTFDGSDLNEVIVPYSDAGAQPAGAGDDVTRWIGDHPATPFKDASERLRFQTIMTADDVFDLAARVTVASPVKEIEGYAAGTGFDPASGGDSSALWGIRISDGAVFAVFHDTGADRIVFSTADFALPNFALAFMKGDQ